MKSSELPGWGSVVLTLWLTFILSFLACSSSSDNSGSSTGSTPNGYSLPTVSGPNVLPLTVNGSTCAANSYTNKPCVSLQLCPPGSSSGCQTINDILLDTGSFGLRIFKGVFNSSLLSSFTPVTVGGQQVAECVQYGDGSKDWGTVQNANVILGGEPAVQVPIQVIDSTYANASAYCNGDETSAASAGFNGILGVGLFIQDCGQGCAHQASNGLYFACNGSSCTGTTVSMADQVQNPVASLPTDNNGLIVKLPLVPLGGAASASGYLVLGIGTQSNNSPSGVTAFSADPSTGNFTTNFNGQVTSSFLDSGSNGYFFSNPMMPNCSSYSSSLAGWYCPLTTTNLTASNTGSSGSPTAAVSFQIGNLATLNGANHVFIEIGGNAGGSIFDWGLPFYLGRNVFVGFLGRNSSLGTGPYWAY